MSALRKPVVFITHCEAPKAAIDLLETQCEVRLCSVLPVPNHADIVNECKNVDGILWISQFAMNKQVMDSAGSNLKVVSCMSAGYDQMDVTEAQSRGIKLGYTPNVNTKAVSEIALTLLLETTRRVQEGRQCIQNNQWTPFRPQWMMGKDIVGSTVGIVGLGGIGQAIAQRIKAFDISRLIYCGPKRKDEGDKLGAEFVRFEDLLMESDFVIVACPLKDATRRLFNDETFGLMKNTAIFINISRGGIVDQDALIRALEKGVIWGAGLDVMTPEPLPSNHPLTKLKNCGK